MKPPLETVATFLHLASPGSETPWEELSPYTRAAKRLEVQGVVETFDMLGWKLVPKDLSEAMRDASRTHHGQEFITPAQWAAILGSVPRVVVDDE
jgi:hypothetical protein